MFTEALYLSQKAVWAGEKTKKNKMLGAGLEKAKILSLWFTETVKKNDFVIRRSQNLG